VQNVQNDAQNGDEGCKPKYDVKRGQLDNLLTIILSFEQSKFDKDAAKEDKTIKEAKRRKLRDVIFTQIRLNEQHHKIYTTGCSDCDIRARGIWAVTSRITTGKQLGRRDFLKMTVNLETPSKSELLASG